MFKHKEEVVANGMPWHQEEVKAYLFYMNHEILGKFIQCYTVPQGEPSPSYIFMSRDQLVQPVELHISHPFEEAWNPATRRNISMSEIRIVKSDTMEELRWWDEWLEYFAKKEEKEKDSNIVDWNKYLGIKK